MSGAACLTAMTSCPLRPRRRRGFIFVRFAPRWAPSARGAAPPPGRGCCHIGVRCRRARGVGAIHAALTQSLREDLSRHAATALGRLSARCAGRSPSTSHRRPTSRPPPALRLRRSLKETAARIADISPVARHAARGGARVEGGGCGLRQRDVARRVAGRAGWTCLAPRRGRQAQRGDRRYSSLTSPSPCIGHIRSTIIGDAIKQIALKAVGLRDGGRQPPRRLGHQFGKLIVAWKRWVGGRVREPTDRRAPSHLRAVLRRERQRGAAPARPDSGGRRRRRETTPEILKERRPAGEAQAGDPERRAGRTSSRCRSEFDQVYRRLGVAST